MTANVLILCGTDACLAPAAAMALTAGLELGGGRGVAVVHSAGVRAEVGEPWCAEAWQASSAPGADVLRSRHRARQVTLEMVRAADVILATERRYRGAPRLLDVHSASRTFTVLEAAALGRAVAGRAAGARPGTPPEGDAGPDERFRWLTEEMDALRGLVGLPAPRRGWPTRGLRHRVQGIDILDPHTMGATHRRALPAIEVAMTEFARCIVAVTSEPVPV